MVSLGAASMAGLLNNAGIGVTAPIELAPLNELLIPQKPGRISTLWSINSASP